MKNEIGDGLAPNHRKAHPKTGAWSPWAEGGVVRGEGDEIRLVAVLDQVFFAVYVLFFSGHGLELKRLSFSRSEIFPPFLSRARLCDEQCLRSPTALITSPT